MISGKRMRRLGLGLGLGLGLIMVGIAMGPIAQAPRKKNVEDPALKPLAEARYQAALKQYELIWDYYGQNRVGSIEVYIWSRLVLDAERAVSAAPQDRRKAIEDHLKRMKALQELVAKIREIGFGRSSDVGASAYYVTEAEYWLAEAKP